MNAYVWKEKREWKIILEDIKVSTFEEVVSYGKPDVKLQQVKTMVVSEVNKEQTARIQQGLKPLTLSEVKKIIDTTIIRVGLSK